MPARAASLVAARVPEAVDFSDAREPTARASGSLSIYRHPADRNAAATGVDLGRALDLNA